MFFVRSYTDLMQRHLTDFKHKLIICNPVAGGGKSKKACDRFLAQHQTDSDEIKTYYTQGAEDRDNIKRSVHDRDPELLIIIGGDGTIHQVLNALDSHSIPVLLIPAGSGNDLHYLCGGQDLTTTIESKEYEAVYSDLWTCNGHIFHNGVGLGFDGSIAGWTQGTELKWLNPQWKYWIAIIRDLLFFKSLKYSIHFEELNYSGNTFMISVANGSRYGGGFEVAPGAHRDDKLLDVVVIGHVPVWKRFFYVPKVQKGRHLSSQFVKHFKSDELDVSFNEKVFAHLDGEVIQDQHFRFEYFGKLKVYI